MKTLFLLLAVFSLTAAFSQDITIVPGQEIQTEKGSVFDYFIGYNTDGIYAKRTITTRKGKEKLETHIIQKIDTKTFGVVYSKNFDLETNEFLDKIFLKGDKILVFTQKYIQEEKAVYLLLREYETLSGNLIGGIKQITISHPTDNNYSPFEICFSPNNTKMAIVSVYEKPKQVTIYETNSNKKIGIKTLIQSYKNVDIASSHNYILDDNGAFFYIFTYNKKTDCIANIQPEATQPLVTDLVYENIQ